MLAPIVDCPICGAATCVDPVCRTTITESAERYTADLVCDFDDQGKFRQVRKVGTTGA